MKGIGDKDAKSALVVVQRPVEELKGDTDAEFRRKLDVVQVSAVHSGARSLTHVYTYARPRSNSHAHAHTHALTHVHNRERTHTRARHTLSQNECTN